MNTTGQLFHGRSWSFKFIAVLLIALAALTVAGGTAEAKPSPASYQNDFNKACRNHGGTTKRVGSRVVRCTLQDGSTVTCDFNTNPPTCTKSAALVSGTIDTSVVVNNDLSVLEVAPSGDNGPKVTATGAGAIDRSFATDEEQP